MSEHQNHLKSLFRIFTNTTGERIRLKTVIQKFTEPYTKKIPINSLLEGQRCFVSLYLSANDIKNEIELDNTQNAFTVKEYTMINSNIAKYLQNIGLDFGNKSSDYNPFIDVQNNLETIKENIGVIQNYLEIQTKSDKLEPSKQKPSVPEIEEKKSSQNEMEESDIDEDALHKAWFEQSRKDPELAKKMEEFLKKLDRD